MPIQAFIFIDVMPGKSRQVARVISRVPGVKLCHPVTGPYDVIAFAEAESVVDLGDLVIAKIQSVAGVKETLTSLALE
jgi:DNA-binding Lrp family transcriptional regulator